MKRSLSPNPKPESSDKKIKSDEENGGNDAGGPSQCSSVEIKSGDGGGGEPNEDVQEKKLEQDPSSINADAEIKEANLSTNQDKTENEKDDGVLNVSMTEENTEVKKPELWQLVPTTVRQRMNYLLTTSKLNDCTFLVGQPNQQQEFKLHSLLLSMTSPEFEQMLNGNNHLVIPDVEPDVFKQILEYVYLDYVNLWNIEKTQALYRASVKFKLPHLCEKAVEYMMAKMSIDSIWPIFDAALATQDQILTQECTKFCKKNISELLKHPKFSTVNQSVISNLVADENLAIPEAELVEGVLRWVNRQCLESEIVPNLENKRNKLLDTIYKLRFLALPQDYFVKNVAYSKSKGDESILSLEESYAILMNLVQPKSYPMPDGFSRSTNPRTITVLERLVRRLFNPLGNYQAVTPQTPRMDKLNVLPGPSLTAPFGCKSFSLDLVTSRNIILSGIQVPTFFPSMVGPPSPKAYEETYMVSIQNTSKHNKPLLGSINWAGKVGYNSFMDLHFKDGIKLEKHQTYTIMVYTNNTYYLNQKLCTVEETKGVKFTLKDSVSLFGKSGKQDFGFISQIIYSL